MTYSYRSIIRLVWPLAFVVKYFGGSILWLWSTMLVYVIVVSIGSIIRWRLGAWKNIKVLEKGSNGGEGDGNFIPRTNAGSDF